MDTPHLGSPFAQRLDDSIDCKRTMQNFVFVSQNIVDLRPDSALIKDLAKLKTYAQHIPTHAIAGEANNAQTIASQTALANLPFGICSILLPSGGFASLFNHIPNDLIVGQPSAAASGVALAAAIPTSKPTAPNGATVSVVHTVDKILMPKGPDILGRDLVNGKIVDAPAGSLTAITQHVIDLLNTSVASKSSFAPILP